MSAEVWDLLILTDATASMGNYLEALNTSLPEIIRISSLTGCFERIGVVAYRDYNGGELVEWSGWYSERGDESISREKLLCFVKSLTPEYGGDWPEATKTGLAKAYEVLKGEAGAKTLMLLFADAPPHTPATMGENRDSEIAALSQGAYRDSTLFTDWVSAANTLSGHDMDSCKTAQVFGIIKSDLCDTLGPYTYLCTRTNGACFKLDKDNSDFICRLTLAILLAWMDVEKAGVMPGADPVALGQLASYIDATTIHNLESETDDRIKTYWVQKDVPTIVNLVKNNMKLTPVNASDVKKCTPTRGSPVPDFAKRYRTDAAYRETVVRNLEDIVDTDVTAIAHNPVFGSLWRAVCNDRLNEARDGLIAAFSEEVNKIDNPMRKNLLKKWLAESYNFEADILDMIRQVPEEDRFPCVFVDPTAEFLPALSELEEEEHELVKKPVTSFTREELLEIGRSCDPRILRRLGRVLMRLTYVDTKEDLPDHIGAASDESTPCIPLALAAPKYQQKFWKILLHTVLPGTLLSPRPAALLAALSLRMGIKPLQAAADTELLSYGKWNSLEIPETWNASCLELLLEADRNYRSRVTNSDAEAVIVAHARSFLPDKDRDLFTTLVDYKILEMNLHTTLEAEVGWTPEKTISPMGPVIKCKSCEYPRSVTIMGPGGVCGLCLAESLPSAKDEHWSFVTSNVSKDDNEKTNATWVECALAQCRAQYVVYHPDMLRVRPKCYHCRQAHTRSKTTGLNTGVTSAPCLECTKCLNRITYPAEYRGGIDASTYECPACSYSVGSKAKIERIETTAADLAEENGTAWLLTNKNKVAKPFNGRSMFNVIITAGTDGFTESVRVLPESSNPLTLRGKPLHNTTSLISSLREWVASRRAQAGTCSCCFSDVAKPVLKPACGRRGCTQRMCLPCRESWYSENRRGRLIDVGHLTCPFCRRLPSARTVSAYGLHTLADARRALDEAGAWYYAWCTECGHARPYAERACARERPTQLKGWECDDCRDRRATRRRIKNCPGCGVPTEKTGGCDHIECPADGCETHWCFFCGEAVDEDGIYDHMEDEHGGIYGGHGYESDEDEDEDEGTDYDSDEDDEDDD